MGFFTKMLLFGIGGVVLIIVLASAGSRGTKKEGNPDQTKEGAKASAKIGDEIQFGGDSTWVVLAAEDKGTAITSNNPLQQDAQTTGRFILVHFKVTNLGKKEQRIVNTPKLIDSQQREFKNYDHQTFYIPKGGETMTGKAIPASLAKEFYAVYEVPPDAKGLRFQTRDLSSSFTPDFKLVDLGF